MTKSQSPILFIDSGIGGLSTLAETARKLNADYIYFADNKFAPYGTKSDKFIKNRLSEIISKFIKLYNINTCVLACNTATTTAVNFLRKKFPRVTFIGTEPAYKIALDAKFSHPCLLATPQTIKHLPINKLHGFKLISCATLAGSIEHFFIKSSPQNTFNLLKDLYILTRKTKNSDCLILGCTHYTFIKDKLKNLTNFKIIDGNAGVSKRISSLFSGNYQKKSSFKIVLSDKNKQSLQKYKKILNQILANQINLC